MRPRSVVLLLLLVVTPVSCRRALPELEEVAHPPTEGMETKVRERTESLRSELDQRLERRERDALASAFGALGRHYHAHELHEAALACYQNAKRLEPGVSSWSYLIGVIGQALGDLDLAAAAFEAVIARSPGDTLARVRLAEVHLGSGAPAAAEAVLANIFESGSDIALAHFFQGRALMEQGRASEALLAYERALGLQPEANAVYYEMALAARAGGDDELAAAHLARRGDTEVTIDDPLLAELSALNVGAVAHLRRGARAQMAGDWGVAEQHYRRAVEADPSNPEARQSLAGVLAGGGDTEEAIEHYRAALAGDPGALPRTNLASLLVREGQWNEALSLLDEALALDPAAEHPRLVRAAALGASGRFNEAVRAYEELLAVGSDRPELYLGLARSLAGRGDMEAALDAAQRSIEFAPEDPESHFVRANLLGQNRRYREAAGSYSRVTDLAPEHAPAWLGEITAWTLAGELEIARQRAEVGLHEIPGNADLRLAREELDRRRQASE